MNLDAILRLQSGVISSRQAQNAGISPDQIQRHLSAQRWRRVLPGVYVPTDRDLPDEARVWAGCLWAGDAATVSGLAAAWWHGLWPDPPSIVDVTVPQSRYRRPRPGVVLRRRDLIATDRVAIRGLPITAIPLTVLEASVALGPDASTLLDRALQRRVSFEALHRAYCRNIGRKGSTAAGRLLTAAADRTASAAERRLLQLLNEAGFTGWRLHYLLGGYELDLAFPQHKLAIEIDGWAWHQDVRAFRRDRQRQNALVLAGWIVLRFTWHDLTERPRHVIAEISVALTARLSA